MLGQCFSLLPRRRRPHTTPNTYHPTTKQLAWVSDKTAIIRSTIPFSLAIKLSCWQKQHHQRAHDKYSEQKRRESLILLASCPTMQIAVSVQSAPLGVTGGNKLAHTAKMPLLKPPPPHRQHILDPALTHPIPHLLKLSELQHIPPRNGHNPGPDLARATPAAVIIVTPTR